VKFVPLKQVAILFFVIALTGCNYPSTPQAPTVDQVGTAVAGTLAAEGLPTLQATSPTAEGLLPHSVYYISSASGSAQIWRLDADGVTQTQVTNEAAEVYSFDVSASDGSIAYLTNNQLYLANGDGSDRRLLVDDAAANQEASDYVYRQHLAEPKFSPDGRNLAYAFDGVWLLDLSTNQAVHVISNQLEKTDEGFFPSAIYAPLAWSPNSERLLLTVGDFESSSLAILDPNNASQLIEVQSSSDFACCQVAWAPDSSAILVASPYIGLIEPGLWRFDPDSGSQTELIATEINGLFQFAGWPLQLTDGSLRYFYTSSTEIPSGDLPLFMMRSDSDGVNNRVQTRSDSFSNIGEILWAEDGSLALIVQLNPSGDASGAVVLAQSDGLQLQILMTDAKDLKWGP
jgi:Tol biopolymer transport system component